MSGPLNANTTAWLAKEKPKTGQVVRFTGVGYGTDPCPECGVTPGPGELRVTVSGVWRVWHESCWDDAQELI